MMDKRDLLLDTAYTLFKQNGYQATSIQQIADRCGIAKGSVYTYFSSKQNLLIALLTRINNRIVHTVRHIRTRSNLSKREKYLLEIQAVLGSTTEQRLFQAFLSQGTVVLTDELDQHNASIQRQWMDLQAESLLDYFGEECRSWLGDISLCINGMIDSYCYLLITAGAQIDVTRASEIILLAAEGLVDKLRQENPPPAAGFDEIRAWLAAGDPENGQNHLNRLKHQLEHGIRTSLEKYPAQEITYAQGLLQAFMTQMDLDSPDIHIIRALLTALQGFPEISFVCSELLLELGIPL